jgi:ATP-binding cassette, subfamily C, bacterial CydD
MSVRSDASTGAAGTSDHGPARWLNQQAPRWLHPSMLALAAVQAGVIVAQAWWLATIIHRVAVDQADLQALWPALAMLALLLIMRTAAETVRGTLAATASSRVRSNLTPRLFGHMVDAGPALRGRHGSGALASIVIEQVDALDAYYARYLPQLALVASVLPFILLAVLLQDWLAGLFLLLAAPLIPLFMVLIGMGTEAMSRRQHAALARLGGVFLDRLKGMDVIRRFGAEQRESRRVAGLIEMFRERTMSVLRVAFLSSAVLEFFAAVAIAAVAIYIGMGLLGYIDFGPASGLDLRSGLFILLLAPEFFLPLRQLSQFWHDRAGALAAATSIREVLSTPPARSEPRNPSPVTCHGAARLGIRGLSLAWPERGTILRDIDFDVAPGERVVIVGASGSGKSTLLKLLAGFMEPDRGNILVDGMPLSDLSRAELARLRGWTGQGIDLVNGTLADNLRLGHPQAGESELWNALELAGLAAQVRRMPLGLDTPVTQDGEGLSGGQARRLAIARALAHNRPLLLLDEPTASLDPESAAAIWRTLADIGSETGSTIVCASHDPLATGWADRTLLLVEGRMQEHPS